MKYLGKKSKTNRGFALLKFNDLYDTPCSLQASSLVEYEIPGTSAVWLGTDDAEPRVLASQAATFGVSTKEIAGWVPFPIPKGVSLSTRMHLDRKQVSALIAHLKHWLEDGEFR